jgi:hypothetical protein
VLLLACRNSAPMLDAEKPSSSLDVKFGTGSVRNVSGTVSSSVTTTRLLVQVSDQAVTVVSSTATPVQLATIDIAGSTEEIIWAKDGDGSPLIATRGTVTIMESGSKLVFTVNVSKDDDASGSSMTMSGSITGIPLP